MGKKNRKRHRRLMENLKREVSKMKRHSISPKGYVRVNIKYPIHWLFANMGHYRLVLAGHVVKMWSKRYQVFRERGVKCAKCGIKGRYFRLECHGLHASWENNTWHFNLYALDENGNEVLMTKDHIFPKSKGGGDGLSNLQPMCANCNVKKGNSLE